uniref:WD repeat domain 27 n=1 Tax=Cynoglossus semilaevis TaxID=244447 RepID=A0A3P8V4C8_CYNSE
MFDITKKQTMIIEKLNVHCDRLLSHHQLACCRNYCGIPMREDDGIPNLCPQPTLLTGHHGEISCMTFGKKSRPLLLCSASADYIIVWNIEYCQKRLRDGKVAVGTVIGTSVGDVVHLSFCFTDETVAACSGATVYILCVMKQEVIHTLTGHLGPLISAEFCPWNKNLLVTTSEDRTFKVWDLKTGVVWYQSFVLSASLLLCTLFLEGTQSLIAGSADGQVWCFSVHDEHKCRLVTKMDLQKMEKRHRMLQDTISHQAGDTYKSCSCCKGLCNIHTLSMNPKNNDTSWLCIGSSDGLYVVDLDVSELITVLYFKGMVICRK